MCYGLPVNIFKGKNQFRIPERITGCPGRLVRNVFVLWYASPTIHLNNVSAIDFLYIQTNVIFTLAVAHSPELQKNLDVSISFDGLRWLSYRSQNGIFTEKNRTLEQHLHTFLFDSREFSSGFKSFRYISFKALQESDHHFQMCEIQNLLKKNITNIRHDFHRLTT